MHEDLTGEKFGHLTVVELDRDPGKKRGYWICRCECGNLCSVQTSHLKSGHTKSCGCIRKNRGRSRYIDLTGQVYGRLTVLGNVDEKTAASFGYVTDGEAGAKGEMWLCRCSCGNICVCTKERLRSGTTRSCGCLQNEQRKKNMKKAIHFSNGTCVERIACRKTFENNTSGHRGVYRRENGKWRACIGFQGKLHHLGNFEYYEDAVAARIEAEKKYYDTFLNTYKKENLGDEKDGDKGTDENRKNVSAS